MVNVIEQAFPGVAGKSFSVTSATDAHYNCIAWAAGVNDDWWWPGDPGRTHWPASVPREESLEAFRLMFGTLGFEPTSSEEMEPGFEKIAIFANAQGRPKHAARQRPTGRWTSKLGKMEDIEHDLRDLEGAMYGSVVLMMKRNIASAA